LDAAAVFAAPRLDQSMKRRFLLDATAVGTPSRFDAPIEVSRPRRGFRLLADRELRFRSLRCFFGHRPTPWICGFARRYISRPGFVKALRQSPGAIKGLPRGASGEVRVDHSLDERCVRTIER